MTVEAAGMLQPTEIWSVRSEEAGVVRDVLVRMGDTVRAGQPIARFDTLQLASDLERVPRKVLQEGETLLWRRSERNGSAAATRPKPRS